MTWKIKTQENKDGSLTIFLTGAQSAALGLTVGDRLVWTLGKTGVRLKKRTKRYRLKKDEFNSFVRA
jgi:hypothetical protein